MNSAKSLTFTAAIIVAAVFLNGCTPPDSRPTEITAVCDCDQNPAQIINSLNARIKNAKPISAKAKCLISTYRSNGQIDKESMDANLRFYPPGKMLFKGDKLGEIWLGTNDNEFWVRIKPQISTFWKGSRTDAENCPDKMWLNPNNLIDALGMIYVDENWPIKPSGRYYVLTRQNTNGTQNKKVYIDCCDMLPKKIEYFTLDGNMPVMVNLNEYITTEAGAVVPTKINILKHDHEDVEISIQLKNIKDWTPTEKQLNGKIFKMPARGAYKKMYQLNKDCDFIEIP